MSRSTNARSGFSVITDDYEIDHGDCPAWLKDFAKEMAGKTAVEVIREQQSSFIDQISGIVNNKSKFSTVEDAVADYQERTGLAAYLNKIQAGTDNLDKVAMNHVYKKGLEHGLEDIQKNEWGDPVSSFNSYLEHHKAKGTYDESMNDKDSYVAGYQEAVNEFGGLEKYLAKAKSESKDHAMVEALAEFVNEQLYVLADAEDPSGSDQDGTIPIVMPEILKKFPEIKFFIDNLIKTRHGHIHVPAIQADIYDIYKQQGVTNDEVDDPNLMKYISDIIAQEQSKDYQPEYTRMGDGVGMDKSDTQDTANTDAFNFANPAK